MSFDFLASGQYKVVLGKSFDSKPKKKAPKYFNVKNKSNLRLNNVYGKEAKLEKKTEGYQIEMKHSNSSTILFDADVSAEEEYNVILIYNEEAKTITLERQSALISLKSRKIEQNGHIAPVNLSTPGNNNSPGNRNLNGSHNSSNSNRASKSPLPSNIKTPNTPNTPTTTMTTLHLPPKIATPTIALPSTPTITTNTTAMTTKETIEEATGNDDFDFDISRDMDEILDDDDDDDDDDNDSDLEDIFEEVATAPILIPPTSFFTHNESPLALPITPTLPSTSSIPNNSTLPSTPTTATNSNVSTPNGTNSKKRKFKMASAPIRRLDVISPLPSTPTTQSNNIVTTPLHPETPTIIKKLKSSQENDHNDSPVSSSGSEDESSSGSESGSTDSGSSSEGGSSGSEEESGSGSEDDDLDDLANEISNDLSNGPSAPPSPQQTTIQSVTTPGVPSPSDFKSSPYNAANTPTPPVKSLANNGNGPMSLRALFKEEDEDEEISSSSESDDE